MFAWTTTRLLQGRLSSIAFRVYMKAGLHWWFHAPLYDLRGIDGFQYFPHAALIFAPISRLGTPGRELCWRALEWGAYALAVFLLSRRVREHAKDGTFLALTALSIGPALNSLFSGQVNLAIAALLLLAAVAVIDQRWTLAGVWLVLGVALKPITLVPLAMLVLVYPALRARVALGLVLLVLAPLAFRDASYVYAQYMDCWSKLQLSADPDRRFEDVRGLLHVLGVDLPARVMIALRAMAGVAVAALCLLARKRARGTHATLLVVSLSVNYLLLFNPRSQPNSYVMASALAALCALRSFRGRNFESLLATVLVLLAWSLRPRVAPWSEFWLKPVGSLIFFAVLARELLRARLRKEQAQGTFGAVRA